MVIVGAIKLGGALSSPSAVLRGVAAIPAGLCDTCRHQKLVGNTRGSRFSLCELSKTDPRFVKYPRVPVARCEGYERRAGAGGGS
jgi:hypothetical protein